MKDKHEYERENLKDGAKKDVRKKLIERRLALLKTKDKKGYEGIETFEKNLGAIITDKALVKEAADRRVKKREAEIAARSAKKAATQPPASAAQGTTEAGAAEQQPQLVPAATPPQQQQTTTAKAAQKPPVATEFSTKLSGAFKDLKKGTSEKEDILILRIFKTFIQKRIMMNTKQSMKKRWQNRKKTFMKDF